MFYVNEEQAIEIQQWDKGHECKTKDVGAIGGRLTYSFTPTGLGNIFRVTCACGEELDLTETNEW